MTQFVPCPHCNKALQIASDAAGKQVRCPFCKQVFTFMGAGRQVPPPPTPPGKSANLPPVPKAGGAVPPPPPPGRKCPSCGASLLPGAVACMDCGHLIKGATPSPEPTDKTSPESGGGNPIVRIIPAGLLALLLCGILVLDLFSKDKDKTPTPVAKNGGTPQPQIREDEGPEPETKPVYVPAPVLPAADMPINPDPRLRIRFSPDSLMRFGLEMTKEKDKLGDPKRLTFSPNPVERHIGKNTFTNNTLLRIDGKVVEFGRTGGRSPTRGVWLTQESKLSDSAVWGDRGGAQSVWKANAAPIVVTQIVEIVPGEQVAPGQRERYKDTCLVRYFIENRDTSAHKVGLRFLLDTFIGSNDGVPFLLPGSDRLCTTWKDFNDQEIPDFIQALEGKELTNPGTIAQLTLKLGGRVEAPSRVTLTRWPGFLKERYLEYNVPTESFGDDSAVVLYWKDEMIQPGETRVVGFAYGLGAVASEQGGGKLAVTVGGYMRVGQVFTVTAYVNKPGPKETVTLSKLPEGLQLEPGSEYTLTVPPVPAGSTSETNSVSWRIKALRDGLYTLRVESSSGATQSATVNIKKPAGPVGTAPGTGGTTTAPDTGSESIFK